MKNKSKGKCFSFLRWPRQGDRCHEARVEKAVVEEIGGRVNKVETKYFNSKSDFDKNFQGSISFWTKLSPTSETVEKTNGAIVGNSLCIATE